MYCKKKEIMRRHIVVVKVTRNKTVLNVHINVNPNGLLTILKSGKILTDISVYTEPNLYCNLFKACLHRLCNLFATGSRLEKN